MSEIVGLNVGVTSEDPDGTVSFVFVAPEGTSRARLPWRDAMRLAAELTYYSGFAASVAGASSDESHAVMAAALDDLIKRKGGAP